MFLDILRTVPKYRIDEGKLVIIPLSHVMKSKTQLHFVVWIRWNTVKKYQCMHSIKGFNVCFRNSLLKHFSMTCWIQITCECIDHKEISKDQAYCYGCFLGYRKLRYKWETTMLRLSNFKATLWFSIYIVLPSSYIWKRRGTIVKKSILFKLQLRIRSPIIGYFPGLP